MRQRAPVNPDCGLESCREGRSFLASYRLSFTLFRPTNLFRSYLRRKIDVGCFELTVAPDSWVPPLGLGFRQCVLVAAT